MKIVPLVTVQDTDKEGNRVFLPPNQEVDLPNEKAKDLLSRGFAVLPGDFAAAPLAGVVSSEEGPQVIQADK